MGEFGPKQEEIGDDHKQIVENEPIISENDARDENPENQPPEKTEKAVEFGEMIKPEELGELLFLLNKAAKRRRDSAIHAHERGDNNLAHSHSLQKAAYYNLKDRILNGMDKLGLIEPIGVHKQKITRTKTERNYHDDDCRCEYCSQDDGSGGFRRGYDLIDKKTQEATYLKLYEIAGFRFHKIVDMKEANKLQGKIGEIKDLGEWSSHARLGGVKPIPAKEVIKKLNSFLIILQEKHKNINTIKCAQEVGLTRDQIVIKLESLKNTTGYPDSALSNKRKRLRRALRGLDLIEQY